MNIFNFCETDNFVGVAVNQLKLANSNNTIVKSLKDKMLNKIIYEHLYDGLTENGNRSVRRTDKIHNGILSYIKKIVPNFHKNYNVLYENSISCAYGNKFKIDILILDKQNNIVCCILLKAFISSVQKNRANNANTTQGEIFRIKGVTGRENVKVWFISLIANETPSYKNDGTLRCMERVETSYVDFSKLENKTNIYHSTIKYDLLNVSYQTKNDFRNTLLLKNIKNITETTLIENAKRIL